MLNASIRNQKILLWIGVVLVSVYGLSYVFLLDFLPPPSPTMSADQVVALYAHSNLKFRLGVVLMLVSGAFYLPMSVVIWIQMARIEKGFPIWAITQALASTVGAWIFAFPALLWGVAAFTVDRTPEITVALHQLAWLSFVTPGSFFPFQLIPITAASLAADKGIENSAFPRWFGWLTLWSCITAFVPTIAQMFNSGPFAWNGFVCFYMAVIIYALWVSILCSSIFRALGRQQLISDVS